MSNLDVLVASVGKDINEIKESLKITSNLIVANQNSDNRLSIRLINNKREVYLSTDTKGVGINRNLALQLAQSDYCILADDDQEYVDEYESLVYSSFEKYPKADVLIFNVNTIGKNMGRRVITHTKRVNIFNFMNYGAVRIAFRRNKILYSNISFSNLFGGGSMYAAGEDVTFLRDCLKSNLLILTIPETICTVKQYSSSWFKGYDEKYFYDKGALLRKNFSLPTSILFSVYLSFKFSKVADINFTYIFSKIFQGIIGFTKFKKHES